MSPSQNASAEADPSRPSLEEAIINPGAVKINVQGAYIVDDQPETPDSPADEDGIVYERKDIRLPHHTSVVSHVAVDIGGSLAKLVYFTRELGSESEGGRLNFIKFETERIDRCIEFIKQLKEDHERLNGSTLGELYSETEPMQFVEAHAGVYPYLLVNIGSGVSMIKVSGPQEFQRVGGTHLGGGTFWGIMALLTGATTFDDMLAMADRGDNSGVDMLVGDIYGMDYTKIGLKSTAIASTFGKVLKMKRIAERQAEDGADLGEDPENAQPVEFRHADMSRSLLFAISNNIGQIAYLQSEKHQLKHIYFGGSFIRGHLQTMNTLSYAIKFWSKGEKQAYFLRHEGYLGAVGAFLKRQPQNWGRRNSIEDSAASKQFREDLAREIRPSQQ
ncbi:hypothetical protein UA08_01878 [Talaromyces atroroseus]|uniref:Pantothenate kinase n=1 Tax=Talaromyces atroroseus TaxID=1441469 RepID=A0A1Q5QAL6_TALAT|nr:hypothetical protein UA08_01878 [Talaromyces atroroseus]OKL62809.1 hypothetical protein UA08_01878 [Talaromyces atroroseus]